MFSRAWAEVVVAEDMGRAGHCCSTGDGKQGKEPQGSRGRLMKQQGKEPEAIQSESLHFICSCSSGALGSSKSRAVTCCI